MKLLQMYNGEFMQYIITKKNLLGMEVVQQFDVPCTYTWLSTEDIVPVLQGAHSLSYCSNWVWKPLLSMRFDKYAEVTEFSSTHDLLDKIPEMLL